MIFRRADAIVDRVDDALKAPATTYPQRSASEPRQPIKLTSVPSEPRPSAGLPDGGEIRKTSLGPRIGARSWTASLYELAPGEATAPYHYEWCREEWSLVVSGALSLRHADGLARLSTGDLCCFPQGPTGAHRLCNESEEPARLVVFSTSSDRPMSTFYPDEDTVLIYISDGEQLLFRRSDAIEG